MRPSLPACRRSQPRTHAGMPLLRQLLPLRPLPFPFGWSRRGGQVRGAALACDPPRAAWSMFCIAEQGAVVL